MLLGRGVQVLHRVRLVAIFQSIDEAALHWELVFPKSELQDQADDAQHEDRERKTAPRPSRQPAA